MKTLTNRSKSTKSSTATALLANATIAGIGGAFKLYRRTLVSELVTAALHEFLLDYYNAKRNEQ